MSIKKRPVSPRQKMINLMYVVLMAMLAMNVSSEVLEGFSIVEKSLARTTEQTAKENMSLYDAFRRQYTSNAVKTGEWYVKAETVKDKSQYLFELISEIKHLIAVEADGPGADADHLRNKESLEAAVQVMISPGKVWGDKLYDSINSYREDMLQMVEDPHKKAVISSNLSTDVPQNKDNKNWKEYYFEEMPAIAVMTFLTKLQNDIRYTEGEVLHTLMANIDQKDVRVNSLDAFVIPSAQTVVQGNRFSAKIGLAAIDTTQVPDVFINGKKVTLKNHSYDVLCSQTGNFSLSGWLQMKGNDGELIKRPFRQDYTVIEPSATVSADMMNMLYAGYDNPISISVPGISPAAVTATMTGGTLKQSAPGRYIAHPDKVGEDVVITVSANHSGTQQQMAQYTFRVRKLPEPSPFITVTDDQGNPELFRGGFLSKQKIIQADAVSAAVDDGLLNIPFRVQSFEMVFFDNMGNAVPVAVEGTSISKQQKDIIKKLSRGKRFYISRMVATGPDGIERKLNTSMEVIIR